MSNIYVLAYKYKANDSTTGILTFTNKKSAIEWARYYRSSIHCEFVTLRQDRQRIDGVCDIVGFIDFYK